MTSGVTRLNALPVEEATAALKACCGANLWVRGMLAQRPFKDADEVFETSERVFSRFGGEDWLAAFRRHPRIGERPAADAGGGQSETWAAQEQAGVDAADEAVRAKLVEANLLYERRYRHIFIVCASGKSAAEMLALLEARLAHDPTMELRVAAEEQRKITRLRLERMLET